MAGGQKTPEFVSCVQLRQAGSGPSENTSCKIISQILRPLPKDDTVN